MTWESLSAFMQEPAGMLLVEIISFIAGLMVIAVIVYRRRAGKHDSITTGAYAGVSLLSYAWQQKSLLFLAMTRVVLFSGVGLLIGKDGYNLVKHAGNTGVEVVILVVLAFVFMFISNIFELVATHYILSGFDHQEQSMKTSFWRAWRTKWMLCKFTAIDLVLSLLARSGRNDDKDNASNRKSILIIAVFTKIIAVLAQLSWKIATYFIMPVLLEENDSIIDTVKKSANTLKNSFGRVVGFQLGAIGLNLVLFFVAFVPLLLTLLAAWVSVTMKILRLKYFVIPIVIGIAVMLISLAALSIINTVMNWIFICLAYNYTQNKNTGPFDRDFIRGAIRTK